MNREFLIKYFEEKYADNKFILETIKEKSTEELQKIYNVSQLREENEKEIVENGTVTYTIDFDENLSSDIQRFMWEHGMFTTYDGKFNYRCSNDGRLVSVPIKFILEIEKHFNITVSKSREMYILGKKDIDSLNVGDKVLIIHDSILGKMKKQGTVIDKNENEIIVRKYKSRKAAYIFSAGEEIKIEKISKFQKAS
jgi:hypothetical protein